MTIDLLNLKALLAPIGQARFFDEYWEKKPLHMKRGDNDFYSKLLSIADLERLIASPDARYPAIQLSKAGAYFPPEVYCDDVKFGSETFTGVPNPQKIAAEYRAGASIVLPALQRTWGPLRKTCASIDAELDHVVHANAYLTPGNTAGFSPHYDTHEVIVLQIAGGKDWRIYEPPIELPHRKQPFDPQGYVLPDQPVLEVRLNAGDLLYLPRGYVHTTTTSNSFSAHITIGIAVYTWIDLAGEVLQAAMSSLAFRKALPVGFAHRGEELPVLRAGLKEILRTLGQGAHESQLVDMFLARTRASPVLDSIPFHADVVVIARETDLAAPDALDFRIVAQGTKVAVEFHQRRFILPAEAAPLLEFMQRQRYFRTAQLPSALDIEIKLALVRSLYDKGFLTLSHAR
jgi:ribosomal protein L16 Arg81 hydroxylase